MLLQAKVVASGDGDLGKETSPQVSPDRLTGGKGGLSASCQRAEAPTLSIPRQARFRLRSWIYPGGAQAVGGNGCRAEEAPGRRGHSFPVIFAGRVGRRRQKAHRPPFSGRPALMGGMAKPRSALRQSVGRTSLRRCHHRPLASPVALPSGEEPLLSGGCTPLADGRTRRPAWDQETPSLTSKYILAQQLFSGAEVWAPAKPFTRSDSVVN